MVSTISPMAAVILRLHFVFMVSRIGERLYGFTRSAGPERPYSDGWLEEQAWDSF